MANVVQKRPVLLTPKFRVAFPQVETKRVFQEGQTGRYSCVALFTPSEFTDKQKQQWAALIGACNKLAVEHFKKPMRELDRSSYKIPFHKGEEKEQYAGFGAGVVYFTMSAYTRKPRILDVDGVTELEADAFYPGCFARASVNPFVNEKWKSISIGMNSLQKLGEGERLDGATSAEEDFGSDPADYDSAGAEEEAGDTSDFE
jgi:Protein of unknown function (DUF2815)